jgi:hypothetical protein
MQTDGEIAGRILIMALNNNGNSEYWMGKFILAERMSLYFSEGSYQVFFFHFFFLLGFHAFYMYLDFFKVAQTLDITMPHLDSRWQDHEK